ncbi:tyrosine-type recombinase/integrase [Streptomyces sp. NPDC006332]|uniref:tyrosine-type recombinase/integrase n=1 Tax=Streptomyces sp. NPDC006332 TaxID=3155456 RepID=UPI00339E3ECA
MEDGKRTGVRLNPEPEATPVREWAYGWLERKSIGEGTRRNYEGFVRNHLVPHLGRKTLVGLRRSDIERFAAAVYNRGQGMAAATINDRLVLVSAMLEAAVVDSRIPCNPAKGVRIGRSRLRPVDADEIPSLDEVDLLARCIAPQYRLTVYLQAAAGLRVSEALALSAECRRSGSVRVRWQVSSRARSRDCRATFVPLKARVEGEYRDIPVAPFLDKEIDAHLSQWAPVPVDFTGPSGEHRQLSVFFAPRDRGKGVMPTASTYGYHFRKGCVAAGLVGSRGRPKYTPRILRDFFASTALAHGIPIHEVSRWLGHRSIKVTVDTYGHLVPRAWSRCREILQNAMRPGPQCAPAPGHVACGAGCGG